MPEDLASLKAEIAALRKSVLRRTPTDEEKKEITAFFAEKITPLNSVAMLPDGRFYTREELMVKLGLDPTVGPEAWICIAGCGSNMSGLPGRFSVNPNI